MTLTKIYFVLTSLVSKVMLHIPKQTLKDTKVERDSSFCYFHFAIQAVVVHLCSLQYFLVSMDLPNRFLQIPLPFWILTNFLHYILGNDDSHNLHFPKNKVIVNCSIKGMSRFSHHNIIIGKQDFRDKK